MGHASEGKSAKRMEVVKPSVGRALEFMFILSQAKGVALGIISSKAVHPFVSEPATRHIVDPSGLHAQDIEVQLGSFSSLLSKSSEM